MRFGDIQAALLQSWIDGAYGIAAFYPNRDYNPATGEDHARLFVLWAGSDPVTLGDTGENEVSGVFQIDLMYATGRGDGELLTVADSICSDYKSGTRLTHNSQQVIVWGAAPTQIVSDGGWLRCSLSINFTAHVRRS